MSPVNILGLSAFYHESACCLLQDGNLVAAAAEERFTRVKHDPRLPTNAYRYCLQAGGLKPTELDCIAYYESPEKKADRQRWSGLAADGSDNPHLDPMRPARLIREHLGYEGPILTFDHHLSHAASAYFYSGFTDAAVLTVDGVGEWATTTYGHGQGPQLTLFEEVRFPHSLGLLYATITAYLGFHVNNGEYKVMGLAPYGRPRFLDEMRRLVHTGQGGQFTLDMDYFNFVRGDTMYAETLCRLFGREPRQPGAPLERFHQDVARSLQLVLEEILLEKVIYLASRVASPNLCLAGGVALNCVANGRVRREGPFQNLFVQPAAGDAGGCLGAAALAHIALTGTRHSNRPLTDVYLGPTASAEELSALLAAAGLEPLDFRGAEAALMAETVERLARGQIVGWFQGAMEFGPRALGARSILANPMHPDMKDRLNRRVKGREAFRPFAPSVLASEAASHFDLRQPSPFMLETCQVISPLPLPAITHVDGSARPQTVADNGHPRFAALLRAFQARTGCPILLNTSLNVRGEPIVCTPVDALICLVRADLDALVLGDFLIDRAMIPAGWRELLSSWETRPRFTFGANRSALQEQLYTFA